MTAIVGPPASGASTMPGVDAVVLLPVKAFGDAKARLAGVLDPTQRARLARWTAERVVAAAGELPVYVACDDDEVAEWATAHGATVLWHPGAGLNGAVNASMPSLRADGVTQVIVAHGDLPYPAGLPRIARPGVVTLVPDRHGDGTNVVVRPDGDRVPAGLRTRLVPPPPRRGDRRRARRRGPPRSAARARHRHRRRPAPPTGGRSAAAMGANEPGQPAVTDPPLSRDLPVPTSALAVGAHPDDVEFGGGGTLAKWAAAGCVVHHLVCTDGSKGTWDPDADTAALVATRQRRAAARRADPRRWRRDVPRSCRRRPRHLTGRRSPTSPG